MARGRYDDPHFNRLTSVVEHSWNRQRNDRVVHQYLIHHLLGDSHPSMGGPGDDNKGFRTSIPLLSMACRVMSRHLISKAPKVLANTQPKELKSWAENAEISANKRIEQSNLAAELRECTSQSMVSFGIMFMGPCYVGTVDDMKLDLEIKAIDRADFVYSINSSTLEHADIQAHLFDMVIQDVHDNPMFDEHCRGEVTADGVRSLTDESSNLRATENTAQSDLYDYVRIVCAYDRRRNKLYYYPRHQPELKLAEMDWHGPRHGPYRFLYFEKPPGNAVPIAPLMHLIYKHRAFNLLDCKATSQAQTQKNLLFYTNASKEEATTIVSSRNNEAVLQENGAVRMGSIGGANENTVGMTHKQRSDFNYATNGVLEQFVSQAPTLGQERLLRGASNEMLEDMAGWAKEFIKGICEDIFWYDLRDPNPNPVYLQKKAEGVEYEIPWTREHRLFAMELKYEIDVEPYSYVQRSPNERLADLLGELQILMGLRQDAAAQGISIDVEAVVRTMAKYKNTPEIYDWLVLNQDPEKLSELLGPRTQQQPTDPMKPNGNYRRESTSDGSGEAVEQMRMMRSRDQNQLQVA